MAITKPAAASTAGEAGYATRERQSDAAASFAVRAEDLDDRWRITVSGELDLATAPLLERELLGCEAIDARPITIDLRRLTFIDLHGLRLLLAASRRCRDSARDLTIVRGPRAVQRVVDITGTEALLPFSDR